MSRENIYFLSLWGHKHSREEAILKMIIPQIIEEVDGRRLHFYAGQNRKHREETQIR